MEAKQPGIYDRFWWRFNKSEPSQWSSFSQLVSTWVFVGFMLAIVIILTALMWPWGLAAVIFPVALMVIDIRKWQKVGAIELFHQVYCDYRNQKISEYGFGRDILSRDILVESTELKDGEVNSNVGAIETSDPRPESRHDSPHGFG